MQRIHKIWLGVAFVSCASTGIAVADDPKPSDQQQQPSQPSQGMQDTRGQGMQGMSTAQKVSLTATVEKIDQKKRTVTLKNDQGNTVKVHVPENVSRLDAVKKGDKVSIDYFESVALMLKKPEAGKKEGKDTGATDTTMAERTPGALPGGIMARKVSETVEITKIDKDNHQVTIKSANGDLDTVKVDESMSADLAKLKKGDRIKASYTEAIALSVTPQEKQGAQGRTDQNQQRRSKGAQDKGTQEKGTQEDQPQP